MSTDPRRGLTRGGPRFNQVVAERIAEEAEKKYTGINLNAAAKLEKASANKGYFSWKLSQLQTKDQRNHPDKYDAQFRERYEHHLARHGGTRRKHKASRKYKSSHGRKQTYRRK
jgi:hypothetical protein